MPRFLPLLLVAGVILAVGCDRRQPANPSVPNGNTGTPAAPAKVQSGNAAASPGHPGVQVPPVVQQPSGPVQAVVQAPKVEVGDAEQRPVLFFELRTGMVIGISNIKYDKFGWVDSYEASVQGPGGEAKLLVQTETPAGGGKAPTHKATINGKPVPRQSDKRLIGLSVKDANGVVLPSAGGTVQINIQTKLSYDPMGRQQVGQQDFQHEGKTYTVTYSAYRRDQLGRLEGYTAQVGKAE